MSTRRLLYSTVLRALIILFPILFIICLKAPVVRIFSKYVQLSELVNSNERIASLELSLPAPRPVVQKVTFLSCLSGSPRITIVRVMMDDAGHKNAEIKGAYKDLTQAIFALEREGMKIAHVSIYKADGAPADLVLKLQLNE